MCQWVPLVSSWEVAARATQTAKEDKAEIVSRLTLCTLFHQRPPPASLSLAGLSLAQQASMQPKPIINPGTTMTQSKVEKKPFVPAQIGRESIQSNPILAPSISQSSHRGGRPDTTALRGLSLLDITHVNTLNTHTHTRHNGVNDDTTITRRYYDE